MIKACLPTTLFLLLSTPGYSQTVPSFPLHPNDLELTRLAQPFQYFDKIGKRAGIMGYEGGTFEAWVWPWKPLRNFELSFLLGTSTQPILAKDIVRTISVTPEATVLTYTYESFTVKEIIVVPRDEPGVILLLDVYSTTLLTIVAGFLPVMQPMWPAGIGGQYSYWDDDVHAYIISEGQWRALFLCGSPLAQQMAAPPAHMFADNPLQFKIDVKPGDTASKFVPIVIAGGSKTKMDSVKATFNRLWRNAESYYNENHNYYRNLRNSTMQVITANKEFNLAYEWGKVALDNLMITNPTLGTGMVAGFGLSGGGARPGFAWFFGGDAFINSLAMNGYGDYAKVRDALAFTQKWQRQENFPIRKKNPNDPPKDVGKMAHELSQSDGLCDWWNDYHYGYNHADTTPWYLVAMGDYVRASGDVEFLRKSWTSVKQAYEWCLSKDSDGDGLMDLKGAGLGALEFGKLVGIYADVYTCGVWVQGIKEMIRMAELVGDTQMKKQAEEQLKKAQPVLEKKFWLDKQGFYSYGATEKGEQVAEKTPWSGVAMMFGLFDTLRTRTSIEAFNGADLCTDWGVRTLARSSTLFEPTNYNYGATWPFISSFFNTAQFKYGYSLAGYGVLQSVIRHAFDNALGVVPEVFSGELNQKLGEAYHHQGFSTTGYMLPFVRGLIGLETDATTNRVTLSPSFPPDWKLVDVKNVRLGEGVFNFKITQTDSSISVQPYSSDTKRFSLVFEPRRVSDDGPKEVILNGKSVAPSEAPRREILIEAGAELRYIYAKRPSILPQANPISPGATNSSLKIISFRKESESKLVLQVEGVRGTYSLKLVNPDL
ncbi:MAG TPA: hypothetical protein DGH68_12290, partial [Bacteroidetes bacterium]|nr:hypothetical protein [Bacteroidota bacterium]